MTMIGGRGRTQNLEHIWIYIYHELYIYYIWYKKYVYYRILYKKTILLLEIIMDNSDSMACWSCECSRCIAARASTEWTPNSCLLYVGTSLCFSWYRTGINMIITDNWMSVHPMLPSEAAFWSFFFPLPSPTKHQKNTTNTCYNEWTTHELEWMELAHESWTGGWLRPADVGMNQNLAWIMQHLVISDVVWYLMWYDVVDVLVGSIWAMCDACDASQ